MKEGIIHRQLQNGFGTQFRVIVNAKIGNYVSWYFGFCRGFENNLTVMFL